MANNSLDLVGLDFSALKSSFISYLQNQSQFKDYDFSGSNISVLIDLLSYNTFKNAFYLNMAMGESFLDSAQLRGSLTSHAKELNYVPRSRRSSRASVSVTFDATGENQPYVIPKGSSFTSLVKNQTFIFTTDEPIIVSSANNTFSFEATIYEGSYFQDSYVYLGGVDNQRFRITNRNVDTSSLTVTVIEDGQDIGSVYTESSTLLGLNEQSRVYFLQVGENGFYEIIFGDDVLGISPGAGAIVNLEYRVSNATVPNGAKVFSVNFNPTAPSSDVTITPAVTTISSAVGGSEEETIESIRYNAPRHFQVQERAVTSLDYSLLLKKQFPEINAINVYGGEEVSPPQFGRVFVSVDISDVDGLPESKKLEYYNFLKTRSPLSIEPIFVEPDFLYYSVRSLIRYNINITSATRNLIKTAVNNTIIDFNEENLDDFNSTLRYSKLVTSIDQSDPSIVSNSTDIELYKKVPIRVGQLQNLLVDFGVPLRDDQTIKQDNHPASDTHIIRTSFFRQSGQPFTIGDDGDGVLKLVRLDGNSHVFVRDVGTVDYSTGVIRINNFSVDSFDGTAFKIYVIPADRDITSSKNTIFTLEPDEVSITVEPVRV